MAVKCMQGQIKPAAARWYKEYWPACKDAQDRMTGGEKITEANPNLCGKWQLRWCV